MHLLAKTDLTTLSHMSEGYDERKFILPRSNKYSWFKMMLASLFSI